MKYMINHEIHEKARKNEGDYVFDEVIIVELLGMQRIGEGFVRLLNDPKFAELQSMVTIGDTTKGSLDPRLTAYVQYILKKWYQGDDAVQSWLMIQLEIAFREVTEEIGKKERHDSLFTLQE
jgi:hypothetical protein